MSAQFEVKRSVAVIGAGPAGLFAARTLADEDVNVMLFNRDIKPGGLAEYGIYPTKENMKSGLRKQFRKIMDHPKIQYFGNMSIGEQGAFSLKELQQVGFDAILVTVGAQGTKWLGLPGEELKGVYHAKDLVYHYNDLPPYSEQKFPFGKRVALIGAGNVMLDIAHWVIREVKVDTAIAIVRRGPAEVKFTQKEFQLMGANLDQEAFNLEIESSRELMESLGQDVEAARGFVLDSLKKAYEPVSNTKLLFDFLASPSRIVGDANGQVTGLEVEETTLVPRNGDTKAVKTGVSRIIDVDSVVFCIGDKVDETFGLPITWNEFAKNPEPQYPIGGFSYEAYDPENKQPLTGIFLAGWSREASSGLVGTARKDGVNGAKAVLEFLKTRTEPVDTANGKFEDLFKAIRDAKEPVITTELWAKLDAIEIEHATKLGKKSFRFSTNREMITALGLDVEKIPG